MKRLNEQGLAADYRKKRGGRVAQGGGLAAIQFRATFSNTACRATGVRPWNASRASKARPAPYLPISAAAHQIDPAQGKVRANKSCMRRLSVPKAESKCLAAPHHAWKHCWRPRPSEPPKISSATRPRVAADFSRFYTEHHIMSESDEAVARGRLRALRPHPRADRGAPSILSVSKFRNGCNEYSQFFTMAGLRAAI